MSEEEKKLNETEKDSIAFNDFKSAISVKEFTVVLEVVKEEYTRLKQVSDSRKKFRDKALKGMEDIRKNENQMPPGFLDKLLEGLDRKANKLIEKEVGDVISRSKEIVEFINRFQPSDNLYPELDFSFIKKK
tara:strand:+ start:1287 stop:1682 length:396 start_codon:yes stop_codon:yes gene_type:complete